MTTNRRSEDTNAPHERSPLAAAVALLAIYVAMYLGVAVVVHAIDAASAGMRTDDTAASEVASTGGGRTGAPADTP